MSDDTAEANSIPQNELADDSGDRRADAWAVIVVFTAAVLMAIAYISGFSFDLGLS